MVVRPVKKLSNLFIVFLFITTLWLLGAHIFSRGVGLAPQKQDSGTQTGMYVKIADIFLGKVEVLNFQRMGFTRGFLRFSPDSRHLAAGTETGDIMVLDTDGKLIWRRNLGLGKVSSLEFTRDGSGILVGETSQQGCLFLFDAKSGQEIWRQSTAIELEVNIREKTYPGVVSIRTDRKGDIYAVGLRYIRHADGHNEYRGRIYKFDRTGRRLGMFPSDHNFDSWVNWMSVDDAGEKLVFGTANWDEGEWTYSDTMYCLDGALERILWNKQLSPVPPYKNPTMRNGPEMSPDGKYVAGIVSDGRCFLYDAQQGQQLWTHTISRPHKVSGVYLNATGLYVRMAGAYTVFTTGNTYNRANWQLPTPVEHPASNNVFVFDRDGNLVNRYPAGGMIEDIDQRGGRLAVAVGRNIRSKDLAVHGLSILSLPEAKLLDRFPTDGPCVAAAVSADGKYAAGIEAPIQLDDGQVVGEYKLTLLRLNTAGTN